MIAKKFINSAFKMYIPYNKTCRNIVTAPFQHTTIRGKITAESALQIRHVPYKYNTSRRKYNFRISFGGKGEVPI